MQVDPIKPTLKAPGTMLLTLGYDEQLSDFAFKLNLCRYHLEVLRWAREHGCPWNGTTCEQAAVSGHLEVLKWAREHDCPWDEGTCGHAALGGHLEMLQWAREHNCPWSAMTCYAAAFNGHLEAGAHTRSPFSST